MHHAVINVVICLCRCYIKYYITVHNAAKSIEWSYWQVQVVPLWSWSIELCYRNSVIETDSCMQRVYDVRWVLGGHCWHLYVSPSALTAAIICQFCSCYFWWQMSMLIVEFAVCEDENILWGAKAKWNSSPKYMTNLIISRNIRPPYIYKNYRFGLCLAWMPQSSTFCGTGILYAMTFALVTAGFYFLCVVHCVGANHF